jgi:hypothetical protein
MHFYENYNSTMEAYVQVAPCNIVPTVEVNGVLLSEVFINSNEISVRSLDLPLAESLHVTIRVDSLFSERRLAMAQSPASVTYAGKTIDLTQPGNDWGAIEDTITARSFVEFSFAGGVGIDLDVRVSTRDSAYNSTYFDTILSPGALLRIDTPEARELRLYTYYVIRDPQVSPGTTLPQQGDFISGSYYASSRERYLLIVFN